jgi:regulator of protease activity HflC (stomatin/prohibitin superfamily)
MAYNDDRIQLPNMRFVPFLAVGLAIVIILFTSFHVVPPGHRGVSITLGKVSPIMRKEGVTFKKPFIERLIDVSIRQRTVEGLSAAFSSDLQTVNVAFKTLYRLPETKVVELFQQYQGDPYLSLVEPRIQEELKQTTSLYRAEELVKSREKIKGEVLEKVKKAVGDIVYVSDLAITNFDFTDELERAIEQKTIREQEALAKSFELDKAKKDAEITIVNAEAEARSVKIKGEALRISSEVIALEIVKKWNGVSPTTVVVDKGGANVLLPVK